MNSNLLKDLLEVIEKHDVAQTKTPHEYDGACLLSGCECNLILDPKVVGSVVIYNSANHSSAAAAHYDCKSLYLLDMHWQRSASWVHNKEKATLFPHADMVIDHYGVREAYETFQATAVCAQREVDHSLQMCVVTTDGCVIPLLNPALPF